GGRERARREAPVRPLRRPRLRARGRHPRRPERAARRDRALLPALQGPRAVEEDGDARLGEPRRGGEDPRGSARARLGRLERGEPLAYAAGERDDLLALVAVERLLPGRDGVVSAAGGLEHFAEIVERVALEDGRGAPLG